LFAVVSKHISLSYDNRISFFYKSFRPACAQSHLVRRRPGCGRNPRVLAQQADTQRPADRTAGALQPRGALHMLRIQLSRSTAACFHRSRTYATWVFPLYLYLLIITFMTLHNFNTHSVLKWKAFLVFVYRRSWREEDLIFNGAIKKKRMYISLFSLSLFLLKAKISCIDESERKEGPSCTLFPFVESGLGTLFILLLYTSCFLEPEVICID